MLPWLHMHLATSQMFSYHKIMPPPLLKVDVSATPLFLFTSEEAINYTAQNKHQNIPNCQEELLG